MLKSWREKLYGALREDRTMRENTRGGGATNMEIPAEALAEFGGYMAPGMGVVDAGGRYPALSDPNQDYYPGLLENVREGNYGMAGMQGLGLLGDAATYGGGALAATGVGAPIGAPLIALGTGAKLPRAVAKGVRAAKRALATAPDGRVLSVDPRTGDTVPIGRSPDEVSAINADEQRILSEMQAREATGEAPFPELANRYPMPGDPYWKPKNPKKPEAGAYLAKGDSAESRVFQKRRSEIIEDMRQNGYTPYFDPQARYNADMSYYPDAGTTQALARPAKDATAQKWLDKFQTPEAKERLLAAIAKSDEIGGGDRWYHMGQFQDEYIREFGPELGPQRFMEDFAQQMAATTGGADPTSNFLTSMYANYLRGQDLPFPQAAYQAPFPIGGRYVGGNLDMAEKVMSGERTLNAADQPKRHNFMRNFLGDESVSTIDEQMMGGLYPEEGLMAPPKNSYFAVEGMINDMGGSRVQDRGWHGFKALKEEAEGKVPQSGKPMIEHINESIERTSRLTGIPPAEVVRRWLRRDMPAYGITGLLGGGLVLEGMQERDQPQGLLPES
jgi:hypothetical protein